jgi:ABC-2 type transport system permease protein
LWCIGLILEALLFNTWVIVGHKKSTQVLELFFMSSSGVVMLLAIILGMRTFAEERQQQTLVAFYTSTFPEHVWVLGKFCAAWLFLGLFCASTLPMPMLIFQHGQVSLGHILAGYIGLLALGAAVIASSMLCSALSATTMIAMIAALGVNLVWLGLWSIARVTPAPFSEVFHYLSLHHRHFLVFMQGMLGSADIGFYISMSMLCLFWTTHVLSAHRWR